jgi:transcriptional regulator with XRE-family HTH domain
MSFTARAKKQKGEIKMNKATVHKPMRRLASIRRKKGLTQGDLAYRIGVRQMTIYYYEAGVREPNARTIRKISTALGVSVDEILEE